MEARKTIATKEKLIKKLKDESEQTAVQVYTLINRVRQGCLEEDIDLQIAKEEVKSSKKSQQSAPQTLKKPKVIKDKLPKSEENKQGEEAEELRLKFNKLDQKTIDLTENTI